MSPSIAHQAAAADSRYRLAPGLKRSINKVFPTHWSFLLGEIALYCFILLLLSGVYLTLYFDPSMTEVTYNGVYQPLRGVRMSAAYESALNISFEVRGGLFVRQVHHWAALLFAASMILHLFRHFFSGSFRRPREANWVIGCVLLILAMFEGFFGYSLPDDLLSGTGLRAALGGITLGIPVIGTWMEWLIFGGEFPGTGVLIPRLYIAHVLLIPGIILVLIAAHVGLVWYQKHTQFPGPGRTEKNVIGARIVPVFSLDQGAFFAFTVGTVAIMGGLLQINPIWNLGPYTPAQVSAGSQPDFYMMWTDGFLRLFPAWEIYPFGHTVPGSLSVALLMPVVFGLLIMYPWIEQRLTKDYAHHNLLQRARDVPVRTAIGAMVIAFYVILTLACCNDIIALQFNISLNATTWFGRIALLLGPPLAYFAAYRLCIGLQRSDRAVLEHGIETGHIRQLPHGEYIEVHQPLAGLDEHGHPIPLPYQGARVPHKLNQLGVAGKPGSGAFLRADPVEESNALAADEREAEHLQLTALKTYQERITGDGNGQTH